MITNNGTIDAPFVTVNTALLIENDLAHSTGSIGAAPTAPMNCSYMETNVFVTALNRALRQFSCTIPAGCAPMNKATNDNPPDPCDSYVEEVARIKGNLQLAQDEFARQASILAGLESQYARDCAVITVLNAADCVALYAQIAQKQASLDGLEVAIQQILMALQSAQQQLYECRRRQAKGGAAITSPRAATSVPHAAQPQPQTNLEVCGVTAVDPNDKVGPQGFGANQYIRGTIPISYTLLFENVPTASASAVDVTITDPLDPSLDLSTLSIQSVQFGSTSLSLPVGTQTSDTVLDLRPSQNLLVDVRSTLSGQVLTVKFSSLDPTTGAPPTDPTLGFLPPDQTYPEGEGSVFFTIQPKPDLPTGTVVRNVAQVVFDSNAPIPTPQWFNTIDNSPPVSQVTSLATTQNVPSFVVQWSGTDAESGIEDYSIYVSDNGGPFTAWLTATTATSGRYVGDYGHTYGFYSIARDLAGNIETLKTAADVSTQIVSVATTTTTTITSSTQNANLNSLVTFTATVVAASGSPTGTVIFLDGATVLGSGTLNASGTGTGTATFSTATLAVGAHTITATYSGAAGYAGSSSSQAIIQTVIAPGLTTALSPDSIIIFRGSTGISTLTLTPVGGFSGTVTLACGTLPAHLSCIFAPSSLSFAGSNVQSSTLVISTLGSTAFAVPSSHSAPTTPRIFVVAEIFSCASFYGFVAFRRRLSRKRSLRLLVFLTMVSACGAVGLMGCGSGGNIAAAGNYVIPVNITASGRTSTLNLTVVVE